MFILAEVTRHPVQNHANAGTVALVHQIHQILRLAVAGGGGKIAGTLIAPGVVQRILGDRQQLNVVVATLLHIGHQQICRLPIAEEAAVLTPPPRAQMDLVGIDESFGRLGPPPLFKPLLVLPLVLAQPVQLAAGLRTGLGVEAEGVGLPALLSVGAFHHVFVAVQFLGAGNKQRPHALCITGHGVVVPSVPVTCQRHRLGTWRPQAEQVSLFSALLHGMRAEIFIGPVPLAGVKQFHFPIHIQSPHFHKKHNITAAQKQANSGEDRVFLFAHNIPSLFYRIYAQSSRSARLSFYQNLQMQPRI